MEGGFLVLSQMVWVFGEKNLKTVFGTPFAKKKKGYIHFCRPSPRSLKNGDAPHK